MLYLDKEILLTRMLLLSPPGNICNQVLSNNGLLQDFPRGKMLTSFRDRSFSVAAPKLWNALPISLRKSKTVQQFKSLLKTYLFKLAFN